MVAVLFSAGDLDRRLVIEQQQPAVDDGMRSKPGGWAAIKKPFAQLIPLNGSERMVAGEQAAFLTQKFRIRRPRSLDLNASDFRVRYRSKVGNIVQVIEIDRDKIDLICTMRDDAGTGE